MRARVFWLITWIVALVACSPATLQPSAAEKNDELSPVPLEAGERLRVVATTTLVGDVVAQVGGEAIQLTVLLPPGADPHTYQPRPSDLAAVSEAHVLFVNGLGLELFLEEMLSSAGPTGPAVTVSQGVQAWEFAQHDGHEHNEVDPHVWFDVQNVMIWADNIQSALAALDPAHRELYVANGAAYRETLEQLDQWVQEQVATVPEANRRLVTNHLSFRYFAERYGFEQIGTIYAVNPAAEPSARDLARLEEDIRQYGVPAVFAENTVNPALSQQVAQDTGIAWVVLYSGSLGEEGSGVESYIQFITYDVRAIVNALGGTAVERE